MKNFRQKKKLIFEGYKELEDETEKLTNYLIFEEVFIKSPLEVCTDINVLLNTERQKQLFQPASQKHKSAVVNPELIEDDVE